MPYVSKYIEVDAEIYFELKCIECGEDLEFDEDCKHGDTIFKIKKCECNNGSFEDTEPFINKISTDDLLNCIISSLDEIGSLNSNARQVSKIIDLKQKIETHRILNK